MLETILGYGLIATLLMALVQFIKKQAGARGIDAMLILAFLSILGGLVYFALVEFQLWEVVVAKTLIIASAANLIYSVFKQIADTGNPSDENV